MSCAWNGEQNRATACNVPSLLVAQIRWDCTRLHELTMPAKRAEAPSGAEGHRFESCIARQQAAGVTAEFARRGSGRFFISEALSARCQQANGSSLRRAAACCEFR